MLVKWKKYVGMHEGARSFIKQMVKMVGTEPLETSNGDYTMLSTYKVSTVVKGTLMCLLCIHNSRNQIDSCE